ncbi:right-handed parallel beta-helix repeat-containing protein [Roseobacter sp. YSTF-M11]|uniref:Right-handed parallel beta-helix repeat-containing protein n=1 Tax=Roseobacter insulae TaxID=2859783 RepID=A0A9X1G046_9RHOB|nr:right-handed parallel beta-helix repeat-containing protein [Roseobacter insulae]MBW4710771.1 right-handed parallel beta-helix repeat-containing protein [Roseobacter insulae]
MAGLATSKTDEETTQSLINAGLNKPDPKPEPDPVVQPDPVIVQPDPVDPDPVDPDPIPDPIIVQPDPVDPDPTPVVDPVGPPDGNESGPLPVGASATVDVISGRVTTLALEDDDIASVKVMNGLDYGNVTVNPDNTLAVVLTGTTQTANQNFSVQVTHSDGQVTTRDINLDVTQGPQAAGWGVGDFYKLETDENDRTIIEHGENHRKVYMSGDEDALTLEDIAAIEGLETRQINGDFFAANPEYGASEDMALANDAGMKLWSSIAGSKNEPASHWLLMERGYEYDGWKGGYGESELNPMYIGAYGEGDQPVMTTDARIIKAGIKNFVVQDVEFTNGMTILSGENILLEGLSMKGESNFQNLEGITLRDLDVYDVVSETPDRDTWAAHLDRRSGMYLAKSESVLIEDSFFDHNGWADGYDAEGGSTDYGQAPSKFSHNVYLSSTSTDVTFRDNIIMRGAATGAQLRPGGFIEDNVFLDNNGGVMFAGGGSDSVGNYTLFTDNLITSGAHKMSATGQGALTKGVENNAYLSSLVDNVIAHLADPNNAAEQAEKIITHDALKSSFAEPFYDDTIIHNWVGSKNGDPLDANNVNTDGLNLNTLDETTIQNFAADLLGKNTATIKDLADHLRIQADGELDHLVDADLIISFFQAGFGLTPDIRADAETLRFIPNDLGDGVRWDNRLNWSTDDLPGTQDGDSVDLGGNWVYYGGTTTLEDLDFGENGKLFVNNGYLQIDDHISVGEAGATLSIDNAGQFWTDGYTDQDLLRIDIDGGRFANTGLFTGHTEITASDNAQVILASDGADFALNGDSSLHIIGDDTKVGFDGDAGDTGVLLLADDATLGFTAKDGELGEIREFYSGHFNADGSGIQSGVNLGDADLFLDVRELDGIGALAETLISADEVIGSFESLEVLGLGSDRDATITVDYENDTVSLLLSAIGEGSGKQTIRTMGNENDAQSAPELWEALTNGHGIYPDDPVEGIPAEEDVGIDT